VKVRIDRISQLGEALAQFPMRERSFFTHLNRDVHEVMYGYMSFAPFSDGRNWSGIFLSCYQAKAELEELHQHHLRSCLRHVKSSTVPTIEQWREPATWLYNSVSLKVGVSSDLSLDAVEGFAQVDLQKLHIHFDRPERPVAPTALDTTFDFLSVVKSLDESNMRLLLYYFENLVLSWNTPKSTSKNEDRANRIEICFYPLAYMPPRTVAMETHLVLLHRPSEVGDLNDTSVISRWREEHGGENWTDYCYDIIGRHIVCYATINVTELTQD
jgi:hypothetical protein